MLIFTVFAADIIGTQAVNESTATIDSHRALTSATVPKTLMTMGTVRRLVADKEHVFFLTGDIGDHSVEPCSLLDVPDDLRVRLTTLELRATSSPEL